MNMHHREVVLILHGLGRSGLSMFPLRRALRKAGYATETWSYNTLRGGIQEQINHLKLKLPRLRGYTAVHAVGHSLGGLMIRGLLTPQTRLPLGRVVFIGTPHKGANVINSNPRLFNQTTTPRIVRDLEADSPAIAKLGLPEAEIGVIAGVSPFNPLNPVSWLSRSTHGDSPNDGTVELSSAQLEQMDDYLEVNANHSFMIWSPEVIQATVNFIRKGRFQ